MPAHWLNALAATVTLVTGRSLIRHFVMAITRGEPAVGTGGAPAQPVPALNRSLHVLKKQVDSSNTRLVTSGRRSGGPSDALPRFQGNINLEQNPMA